MRLLIYEILFQLRRTVRGQRCFLSLLRQQLRSRKGFGFVADPFDHTAEFDPKDISDNKVIAMLCYLLGSIGVIIALLAANKSDYAAFHVRQALKLTVVNVLLGIVAIVLAITIVVPIAAAICVGIVSVLRIIAFFQICCGKAKEPAIIRNLKFLR